MQASTITTKISMSHPQELIDTVNNLKYTQGMQEAQIKAVFSLFGNLEGVASIINTCLTIGGQPRKQFESLGEDLCSKVDDLHLSIEQMKREKLEQVEQKSTKAFNLLEMIESSIQESLQAELEIFVQKQEELQHEIKTTKFEIENLLILPPIVEKIQKQVVICQQFKQEKLDFLISMLNLPFNNYSPELNEFGQSKLTEYVLENGWKWSLPELNSNVDINSAVVWTKFEGAERGGEYPSLQQGIYYGQMEDGKRHGYGIVYSIDQDSYPLLYECEWNMGLPIMGRYIEILDNQWYKREGDMSGSFCLQGTGNYQVEDGYFYQGEWNQEKKHGLGKETNIDGTYNEGEWNNDKRVGIHNYYSKEGVLTNTEDHGNQ
ncbi:hypothetical protein FGO68_gene11931 [Halteria grandinella]|uniref:MORN repeat protein n=1 Tax=Halteria grandinella TaxID=5974 RepID=A0A8J8NV77_HALGN|nr:hypothetical protein FGO68_gene11931 [Halteria grandinella]